MATDTALKLMVEDLGKVCADIRGIRTGLRDMQFPLNQFDAAKKVETGIFEATKVLTDTKSLLNSLIEIKDV